MDDITRRDPIKITAEDINPRYNWGRHLPVLGTMGVDFEERVDYRRMHRYRLGRAQAALEASDLGALLLFMAERRLPLGAQLTGRITIPMAGPTESLNAAMAATVVMSEAARQRRGR